VNTAGFYTVFIRQVGVSSNPCIFTVPNIQIRDRNFSGSTTITQPFCFGDRGDIIIAANNAEPQYTFNLFQGGILINSSGLLTTNNYAFNNLNAGNYTVTAETEDGCFYTEDITIIEPPLLTVTAALTAPITCSDGEITIYPVGGTPPYSYFINSTTDFQTVPEFGVSTAGTYDITVVDSNNCSATTSIDVSNNPAPQYTITQTDILCYNDASGVIEFNIINANGYDIEFSIDNGVSFSSNILYTNLLAGDYDVIIRYTLDNAVCETAVQTITITQPDEALTATAGISQLAGCGPNGEGTIRITNPQGGTPFPAPNFYEYSFDNQNTWTTLNEALVNPGTYTVYIRDANGCVFAMDDVVLGQEPPAPTINISDADFNCDGTANATVTVTNSGASDYSYEYFIDGVLNPNTADPQTFLNVPAGPHTISVEYTLQTVPTFSNLLYETFGYGSDTTSPGINTAFYCFERQVAATQCRNSPRINDGDYSVTSNIVFPFGAWINPTDYTPTTVPPTPNGRFLVVNIGAAIPVTEILYEKEINDIIPNQPIQVEFAAMNLLRPGNTQFDPDLRVALVDASGTEISFYNTGNIPKTGNWIEYPTTPITLNPGNNTTLKFILRSNVQQTSGNDVAIDDIRVFQLPQACTTTVDFPIIIDPGNAFSAQVTSTSMVSCDGNADGAITIGVQNFDPVNGFEYSIDNGVTWVNQMTAPFSIGGLTSGTYSIDVRFDNAPNTCLFTFSETIASADPITISYTNTDVTCLDGATITASAIGGTPNYTFQLIDTLAPFTVTNFGSNGILTNVSPGSYTLNVTDAQGCTASIPLVLDPPETPTATISTASDLCYDTSNGASIEVSAAGGVPPYQYSINGGAFQASNIFNNLTPGSYTIAVRDDFGCEVVLPAQIIQPQLITATTLIKNLDCTLSPDAIITGTISGGYTPYTYEVSINGGPFTSLGSIGTSFTYATSVSGDFQFQITDALGCIALSQVQTIEPLVLPEIISVTESQSILCNGDSNGAIDIVINNTLGAAPFSINVNNNTTATNYGNQTSGLPAGNYTITLTDNNGCTDTATITLAEPDTIVVTSSAIPITCIPGGGVSQGSVIVDSVVGGTAPYTYNVTGSNGYSNSEFNNTGSTSVSFNVINFGLYEINVIDANGCSVLVQNVLVASPPDDLDITINTTADCASGGEATVSVNTLLAGSGPFFFTIYDGTIPPPPPGGTWQAETSPGETIFTGLTPGVLYTFLVFDQLTGCYYFETADTPIQSNATLTANALSINNISCTGNADGNVSFTVNNPEIVDIDFNYEIFDALSLISTSVTGSDTAPASGSVTISDFGALDFGTYYVLITETSGPNANCSIATAPFSITESIVPLTLSTSVDNNANCNPNTGVISAVAQNGTAPYFYQITTNAAAPLASDPNWTSDSVFNVNGGSYYIHALDTFGCIVSSLELVVNTDPAPEVTAVVTNQCTVNEGNYEIEVDLLVNGIAPHSFSIDGGAFQQQTVPFTISNLASGTHTIEVRDVNGCGNSVSVVIEPPLDVTANTTQNPSCSDVDGEITVNGFGGSGNYSYSISPAPPSINLSGNIFSGVPSGTYIITVTDTTTSCTDTVTATLEVATPVNFTLDAIDVICNGENTGAIIVNLPPSNDNPIYTYEILSPIVVAPQTSNVFTGLSAGVYTIQVTSGKNCTATQTIAVSEPNVINVLATTVSQYTCDPSDNSLNFASITVDTVSGGSGNYVTYEFIKNGTVVQFSSDNTYIESDLTGGTYTINVYDDNGCTGTVATSIDIAPFIDFDTTTVNIDNAITCTNLEDITVNVITTGGVTPNLEFIVQDVVGNVNGGNYNQTNNTGIFTGLDVGNYIITVNNLDTGCSTQDVHFVDDPDTFDILINTVESVTCFNDNTGSVNVTFIDLVVSGTNPDQSGAFNYTISDDLGNIVVTGTTTDAGPIDITGLFAGNYTISATLINNPFCTQAKNFTIARPSAPLALFVLETANVTCTNGEGTITASASGGWGNYEFELSGDANVAYSTNGTFSNLSAGNYTVSVRDGLGCIVSENIILVEPDPITAIFTPNVSILNCFGDQNGSISITNVIGGQGSNYTYTLNTILPTVSSSGPQTSNIFNNLSAGTYTVTIADDFGCELTSTNIVISNPTLVSASLVRATAQTCLTESTLTLSATGGTAPYTYSDDSSFSSVLGNFSTSVTFSVPAGTYFYYVRDANNCVSAVSNDITIDPVPTLTIELESDSPTINCAGDTNGNILATATGGLGNYVYTLQDVAGNTISATQNMPGFFTELPAGDYVVLVESGDCVTTSGTISITEPSTSLQATVSVTNVTCAGTNNGIIEVNANGGTGIIKYAISPQLNQFFDTNIFENLSPGIYEIIVQDELGCFLTFSVPVTEPTQVILNIVPGSILPELCAGDNNGEFSVAISGGTMPYSVSLDNYDGPYTTGSSGQTLFDFIDLQGGDHIVFVRDSEGCESEWNITFPESVTINPIVDVLYDCEQDTLNNTITVSVDASITDMTDLDFSINNGPYQASNVFINVAAGLDNFINVRHTNGCIQTTELFDIIDYEPLVLEIVESGLNEITANATGGNGDYTFTFNDENLGSENIYNFEQSGLYTVTVTDSNGCIATARIELVFIEICIPNYFSPNGDGITDTWAPGCIDNYPNLDFDIFDRYGRKVATYRAGQFWDGRYNGTELPTGDYWYVVRTNDTTVDREFVGHFTLYR
jgi:gliding motility-associated-like protein